MEKIDESLALCNVCNHGMYGMHKQPCSKAGCTGFYQRDVDAEAIDTPTKKKRKRPTSRRERSKTFYTNAAVFRKSCQSKADMLKTMLRDITAFYATHRTDLSKQPQIHALFEEFDMSMDAFVNAYTEKFDG